MRLSKREMEAAVGRRVHTKTLQSLIKFVKQQGARLWGQGKTRTFVHDTILLALYKDLFNIGYQCLFKMVKSWYSMSH